ncbi:MAG: type IV pilus secretin PilQ [bacterium]|nr:type IV pilus secretin PilQ [bacterium]
MAKFKRIPIIFPAILCLLLMAAWMYSCSQKTDLKDVKDPFYEQWRVKAEESKGHSAVEPPPVDEEPFEIASKEMAEEAVPEIERLLPTRKISLKMNSIEVSVLLRALAKAAKQNIILNEKVSGKININIHQAPWDQVFTGILKTHGLSYSWEGEILRIMTAEDLEADIRRKARKRDLLLTQMPSTRIVAVKFMEADKLKSNLEKFVSIDKSGNQTGSILVDEHSNSLIVQAIKSDMDIISAVIERLDRPTPQVLIEAYIVEANKDVARELGIQWGGVYTGKSGDKRASVSGKQSGTGAVPVPPDESIDVTSGSVVNLTANSLSGFDPTTLGLLYTRLGEYLLSAQLSALQDQGKLHILSSPSITTMDNQNAYIESGQDVPYQSVEDGEVKTEYKKAVLRLDVTPHVIDGETLKMFIKVNKDEPDFSRTVLGNPTIITKKAETSVIQNDGQTIVIGGLSKETSSRNKTGTPFLEDIPGLGYLFKQKSSADQMEELLIFITPHILKPRASGG